MDISTLTKAAWAALVPLLPVIATKGAEQFSTSAAAGLWAAIKAKFEKKPAAQESLEDLLKDPKDEDFQAAFRVQLKKALLEDDDFAKELAPLVEKAEQSFKATLIGDGAIAQGDNATAVGKGAVNIGGSASGSTIVTGNGNKIGK